MFLTEAVKYFGGAAARCVIDNTHVVVLRGTGAEMVPVPEMEAFGKRFMHYLEYRGPSALDQTRRVLAIPPKKADTRLVRHLSVEEIQAVLNAPNPSRWDGLRDRAMLHLCFAAGLRVSELIGVRLPDLSLSPQASLVVHGKGRRELCLPLWKVTTAALHAWMTVRCTTSTPELFRNKPSQSMTRAGFEYILERHVNTAAMECPSLASKRVPHVLRHTCALTVLQATKDLRKASLWLGPSCRAQSSGAQRCSSRQSYRADHPDNLTRFAERGAFKGALPTCKC